MMYVEQYAQQRMNEQQAERESEWRRIAAHWNEDARTVQASKWAVVRVIDRVFHRRSSTDTTRVPDGARVVETEAATEAAAATETAAAGHGGEPSSVATPNVDPLWPDGSAAGRFARGVDATTEHGADESSSNSGENARREMAHTR